MLEFKGCRNQRGQGQVKGGKRAWSNRKIEKKGPCGTGRSNTKIVPFL